MPRFALTADVAQVAAIYHSVWHETQAPFMPPEECKLRTPHFFEKRMSALLATTLVADCAGSIVGFVSWQDHLVGQLYVSAGHRGRGLAAELITASEIEMAKLGIKVADDDTWADVFSRVLVEKIEPNIGNGRATILYEYPAPLAALARPNWTNSGWV
jgi:elongation factor P--beta-lysine ligase